MITEEQIQAIVRRIVEGYQPDRIILFGSYAYGTPTEDSDLDLLVVKRDAEPSAMARSVAVRRVLRGAGAAAMDILIRTPEELLLKLPLAYTVEAEAIQKGRLLYAA
ncbi:Nucleotidyltransferase domain-containing protein [Hymenobacter daecheongensis DSM 21074]|uniref:Nucleotidyltransferase domain-containing protein n=1 Tax=Hymenobacter daecheongensis DSM 21074 TaxID=1121955 RepID=A0A1M6J725_9BACT|nr:nucleotidyltransferase domain-containing protein [Hymenobacter daecheongensis]SHJ42488.1 Nucleotidyltransferase domain-containing protein [Hymenobacter daecheongensis DSM 21074]